jgi:hypothetical protein
MPGLVLPCAGHPRLSFLRPAARAQQMPVIGFLGRIGAAPMPRVLLKAWLRTHPDTPRNHVGLCAERAPVEIESVGPR